MGSGSSAPPAACDVLKTLGTDTLLGGAATYTQQSDISNKQIRLQQCAANLGDKQPSLQLRYTKATPAVSKQKADMIASFSDKSIYTFDQGPQIEDIALGDGAIWVGALTQLIVWHADGKAQSIVTGDSRSADGGRARDRAGQSLSLSEADP